jgi:hypothetical protein
MVINNVFWKMVLAFLIFSLTLSVVTPGWGAGLTFGRDKLKGDSKTSGDFNLQSRCPEGQVTCSNACVNLQTDSQNCGGCGVICSREQVCSGAICGGSVPTRRINPQSIFK